LEKSCKNLLSVPPFSSGGWELCPQTPKMLLPPAITTLSSSSLTHNTLYCPLKEEKITTVNVLLLLLSHFLNLFITLNSVDFVEGGAKILLALGRRVP